VEIPSGEVYVAPVETSAHGRLVVDQVRDFGVEKLSMTFEKGRICRMHAERGEKDFRSFLEKAQGGKDLMAEFGVGINPGMKPIGLRISDEKALGTIHLAIGNNQNLGGNNDSSIHIDFNLYHPTVTVDDTLFMENGSFRGSSFKQKVSSP
jgi:leucyl aminopeptidase (aminopeptidase T)